jgi:hypothetical protein
VVGRDGEGVSGRAKLNIVLVVASVAAVTAVIFGIQGVVLAYADEPVPPVVMTFCIFSVLVSVALVMWSTAIRRKSSSGNP